MSELRKRLGAVVPERADPKLCNWCGHPKAKHAMHRPAVSDAVGCLFFNIKSARWCQCTAERGAARLSAKARA